MAQNSSLARRLRLGIIGDGAGAIDAARLGAATAFRAVEDGEVARQVPSFGEGLASGAALKRVFLQHDHLLIFDAQIPNTATDQPEVMAEALLWLLNQGVDLVLFCDGCDETNHALNAALDRSHRFGITLLAGVTAAWPSRHPAVIGVAAQFEQDDSVRWLGGEACTMLHGGTDNPAAAVGDVASVLLAGIGSGLVRNDLITHLQNHCTAEPRRRAG